MKIGVLTYHGVPHRKTYDVLCLLKAKGYQNITVYAVPMHYKKTFKPLIEHRPKMHLDLDAQMLCNNFDYQYVYGQQFTEFKYENKQILLVCGAGILKKDLLKKCRVVNAHPGYIPNCRGLDALKWAIYERQPIGVTTHLIGDEVDAGEIIERVVIPVHKQDTFHAVAYRVFEEECKLLVSAIEKIDEPHIYIDAGQYPLHRRMPMEIESELMLKFEKLKEKE